MRIRARVAAFFAATVLAGASITIALVRGSTESAFRSMAFAGDAEKAKAYASLLAEYREEKGDWAGVQGFLESLPELFAAMVDTRIHGGADQRGAGGYSASTLRALLADRVVVADSRGLIVGDTARTTLGTVHPSRHLEHGIPILAGGGRVGAVLVGSMVDSSLTGADERFLASVVEAVAWSAAAAALVAVALGLLLASRLTEPIRRLAAAAGDIAAGRRPAPLPERGEDELALLSRTFNEMSDELQRLDEAKKRVIADSAHELRTPVTLIQGTIEGMIDGVLPTDAKTLESVHEEAVRLSRLIDTLRELELIDSGELELAIEAVDLAAFLRKAADSFAPAAAAKGIRLWLVESPAPSPPARGDGLRLGEVVYNLVSNAIKYSPEGGSVRLSTLEPDAATVGFLVDDSGPGIAPDQRGKIFERFYRIDRSRSTGSGGRGLGLSIASEIVGAHGGVIDVSDSDLGGARFAVTLPRFAPAGP